jgi:hypothetical protein
MSAPVAVEKPWRGTISASPHTRYRAICPQRAGNREGAALVAEPRLQSARVPRPSGERGGGSGGGPMARSRPLCLGTRVLSMGGGFEENPKNGAKPGLGPSGPRPGIARLGAEQRVKVVETAQAQSTGDGCPKASEREASCTYLISVEGERGSMSGGNVPTSGRRSEASRAVLERRPCAAHARIGRTDHSAK